MLYTSEPLIFHEVKMSLQWRSAFIFFFYWQFFLCHLMVNFITCFKMIHRFGYFALKLTANEALSATLYKRVLGRLNFKEKNTKTIACHCVMRLFRTQRLYSGVVWEAHYDHHPRQKIWCSRRKLRVVYGLSQKKMKPIDTRLSKKILKTF